MSLKAFHIFFIVCSTVVSFLASFWAWRLDSRGASIACLAAGVALVVYLAWFLKKGEGTA